MSKFSSEKAFLASLTTSRMLSIRRAQFQKLCLQDIEVFAKTKEGKFAIKLLKILKRRDRR